MNRHSFIAGAIIASGGLVLFLQSAQSQNPHELVKAKDGSGVYGYKDTPILPWCGYHVHDPDRPAPKKVVPGKPGIEDTAGTAPSDAIVLFGGKVLSQWEPSEWEIEDGILVASGGGLLVTKQAFGDVQLHLEWQQLRIR